jgi:hypothetical protein
MVSRLCAISRQPVANSPLVENSERFVATIVSLSKAYGVARLIEMGIPAEQHDEIIATMDGGADKRLIYKKAAVRRRPAL